MSDLEMLQADGTWKKIGTVDPKTVQALEAELFQTEIPGNLAEGETVQEFRVPAPMHTPGPWKVIGKGTDCRIEAKRNGPAHMVICERVNGYRFGTDFSDYSQLEANARLIAQAPT